MNRFERVESVGGSSTHVGYHGKFWRVTMTRNIRVMALSMWFAIGSAVIAVGQPPEQKVGEAFYYARGKKIPVVITSNLQAVRVTEGDLRATANAMATRLNLQEDGVDDPVLFADQRIVIVSVASQNGNEARIKAAVEDLPGAARAKAIWACCAGSRKPCADGP